MFTKILTMVIRGLQNVKSFFILKLFFAYSYYSNVYNEYVKFYNQKTTTIFQKKLSFISEKKKLPEYLERTCFQSLTMYHKKEQQT